MAAENVILDPGAAIGSSDIAKQTCNITLIYGSDDPDKGYNIPSDKIVDIIIRENFFLLLPTMTLKLTDVGSIFHDVNFQIGNTIYIKVIRQARRLTRTMRSKRPRKCKRLPPRSSRIA